MEASVLISTQTCTACGAPAREGAAFCGQCGSVLPMPLDDTLIEPVDLCRACGAPMPRSAAFCGACGAQVEEPLPPVAAAPMQRTHTGAIVAAALLVAAALIALAAIALSGPSASSQPSTTTQAAAPPISSSVPAATVLTPVAAAHPRTRKGTAAGAAAAAFARSGAYLERLSAICAASASGLSSLQRVLAQLAAGQIAPATAARQLDSTIRNRSALLAQIDSLPAAPPAEAALGQKLRAAVEASRAADLAYQRWVSGLPARSRGGSAAQSGADWTAVSQGNSSASVAKQTFVAAFARAAARSGVATRCTHL
jgi:Meckel syndrome type 1 protein